MKLTFSLLFLISSSLLEAKVSLFAHYFGQPEFIKYQYLFFKKNLQDDYEFIVFEDSNQPAVSEEIQNECQKYGIPYVRIPSSVFENPKLPIMDSYVGPQSPSFQCSIATQYIYDNYVIPSKNICLILDNDIFLLSPFSIENHLGSHAFSYAKESRRGMEKTIHYMLPNFIMINPTILPDQEQLNFNMGIIDEALTDAGGYTHFYLQNHEFLGSTIPRFYLFNTDSALKNRFQESCSLLFNSKEWSTHYFLEKDTFLHMRMGSNWSQHPNYSQMKQELSFLFDTLLSEDS